HVPQWGRRFDDPPTAVSSQSGLVEDLDDRRPSLVGFPDGLHVLDELSPLITPAAFFRIATARTGRSSI
ncbi:MAG: hypothetical protein ACRD0L_14800, partial [Acidimicrobiales bacterium]